MTLDYRKFIQFFFPPSEDEQLLQEVELASFLKLYTPMRINTTTALLSYTHPHVKAAIHLNKYHHHRKAQLLLARILGRHLQAMAQHDTYIVPIPLSRKRLRVRGYNQTTEVVQRATHNIPHFICTEKLLTRTRNTQPQTTLKRAERLKNMNDAFAVRTKIRSQIAGKHIILIDDVITTGATMQAAAAALQQHSPASLTCIALAH